MGDKKARPKQIHGNTDKIVTGCGNLYITVNILDGKPFEVFASLGKAGACEICQIEAITRSITLGLRYGITIDEYIRQLKGISCPKPAFNGGKEGKVLSCPDAIATILEGYIKKEK